MPGSSRPALPPSICGCQCSRLNSSTTRSRMPTRITVLPGACCRCLSSAMTSRASSPKAPRVSGLPVFSRECFRPRLRPGHRLAGEIGDAVDEDDPLAGDAGGEIRIGLAEVAVVRLGEEAVGRRRRVDAADQAGDVDGIGKGADRDAVALPALDRLETRLQVDAQRLVRRQRHQLRRLADAARPEQGDGGLAVRLGEALIGGDDAEIYSLMCPSARQAPRVSFGKAAAGLDAAPGAMPSRYSPRGVVFTRGPGMSVLPLTYRNEPKTVGRPR